MSAVNPPVALMPPPIFSSSPRNWSMDNLIHGMAAQEENIASGMWHPGEWLMGFIVPPFQRPVVWSEQQMIRFIESAWDGFHLGTFVVNNSEDAYVGKDGDRPCFHKTDRWLIDGQQRLTAVHSYVNDAFPVGGWLWSEITRRDHLRFKRLPFAAAETRIHDETALKALYDRLAFGGVAHEAADRALPDGEAESWTPRR